MVTLNNPSDGWKRIDDTDSNITYSMSSIYTNSSLWNGNSHYLAPNSYVKFNFFGTKLRIISFGYNDRSVDNLITIDGDKQFIFSERTSGNSFRNMVFDIQGLEYKEHSVYIQIGTGSSVIDAIDVDDIGYLLPYRELNDRLLLTDGDSLVNFSRYRDYYYPNMTSNATPSPLKASASSNHVNYDAWKIFNSTTSNGDDAWAGSTVSDIILDFGVFRNLGGFIMKARNWNNAVGIGAMPKDFNVFGSLNGIDWFTMGKFRESTNWSYTTERTFEFNRSFKTKYFKISILSNNGSTYSNIGRIFFIEQFDKYISLPYSIDKKNFKKYGNNSLDFMNTIFSSKYYILQDKVSENEQGLWTTQINRKPLSISFN